MPLQITFVHQFEQQKRETWDLAFSADGKQLVSSDGSALYLWQLNEEGMWNYERSLPFQNATFPRFAPDGKMLAFGGKDAFVKLISCEGKELATFPSPSHASWAFSPDQRWFVCSDIGRNILLWDLVTFQNASIPIPFPAFDRSGKNIDQSNEMVGPFFFLPDGQHVVLRASSSEGYLHVCSFEPEHRRIIRQKTLHLDGMIDGAISPDGRMLALIVPNGQIFAYKEEVSIYDLESPRLLQVFPQTTEESSCLLAFSPDSHYLMSCKTDGWVDLFSLETFECLAQFAAHPGLFSHANDPVGGLAWSKTGYLATGGANVFEDDMDKTDYTIKIWKVEEE
jgi:WD40 repeat protein